jgi:hypothetical protein
MLTEENLRKGMGPEEARYAARAGIRRVEQTKEVHRERRACRWLTPLSGTFCMASTCDTGPLAFTGLDVLTIGIGANIALFSIIRAVFLQPFPYPDARGYWKHSSRR